MPPRDFSEDGAANAGSGFDPNFGAAGAQTGGKQVGDFGGNDDNQWETGSQAMSDYTKAQVATMDGDTSGGGYRFETGGPNGPRFRKNTAQENADSASYAQHMYGNPNGMSDPGTYTTGPSGFKYTPPTMFAGGGAIPDDDDTNGSPEQDALSKALSSVDQVLAFGRKLHGLGGGMNEGAIQDTEAGSAGSADSPRFQDFRKSPNMEDRRGQQTGPVEGALNDFAGKAYSIYDRATSPNNPIDQSNPIAKDLGGDELSSDKPAIDTDEDNQ